MPRTCGALALGFAFWKHTISGHRTTFHYPKQPPMQPPVMFTDEQKQRIVSAIQSAERNTSGEMKVHVERNCAPEPMLRAKEVFVNLALHRTRQQNGVLFYIALDDHKFAILGDAGIIAAAPDDFWETTKNLMRSHFRQNQIVDGICAGIEKAGEQLKAHFPFGSDDVNELSDDISFGV